MRKRFFRKSILLQAIAGCVLALLLVVPAIVGYASHPFLSCLGIGVYALLNPTLGMMIEARVK